MSAPRLRLLKVTLQATYALDDGETLVEQQTGSVVVSAKDWPAFAARDPVSWVAPEGTPMPSAREGAGRIRE